jgi:hypothetical protein
MAVFCGFTSYIPLFSNIKLDFFARLHAKVPLTIQIQNRDNALKRSGSKSCGSFTAWGTGFKYEYRSSLDKLDVLHDKTGSALIQIDLDKQLSSDPESFIKMLDKSCQVRALTLSNNTSIDLSETFEERRLMPMLAETARLARLSFDLMHENFEQFDRYFCQDTPFKNMKINRIRRFDAGYASYSAQLETKQNNKITVESETLHGVMSKLSQKIIQDLITREFVLRFDASANLLLSASSKISILSMILNDKFTPERKLKNFMLMPLKSSQSNK